jgi:biopolymer transport protein ExbD
VLEVAADKALSINRSSVTLDALPTRLQDIYSTRRDKTLFLIGAPTLRYGDIVLIIDAAKGAGITQVGIVTEAMRRTPGISD